MSSLDRVKLMFDKDEIEKLSSSKIALFGIGGVGGICAEALIRTGITDLTIIDGDVIEESNVNRQIIATTNTIGQDKVSVLKNRLTEINPKAKITPIKMFYLSENSEEIDLSAYDYVIDCIDTVSAKIEIITRAKQCGVKVISSMGTAGKFDYTKIKVDDISKTSVCPLAKVVRQKLAKLNVKGVKVVYSTEEGIKAIGGVEKKAQPSTMIIPSIFGLIIAEEVIIDLVSK